MNEAILEEKAGLMSHAVKTESARSELLRETHVDDGTGPVKHGDDQIRSLKQLLPMHESDEVWL